MTKREARKWIRKHWAGFVELSDVPAPCPPEVWEVWGDECRKIAERIDRTLSQGGRRG